MPDTFGNDKPLPRLEINRTIFQIDDEVPLQDKEELIVVVVFMPVILTLHDPEANNGVVHPAERLVIPLVGAGFNQHRNVYQAESRKLSVEVSRVRIILLFAHRMSQPGIKAVSCFPPNTRKNADISKDKRGCDASRKPTEEVAWEAEIS
jgi:hypothetical protein